MQWGQLVFNIVDYACLSHREKELLSHVLAGHPNKVIGQHLGVTQAAAKVQLESLLQKINVDNRTQAVIWALANLPELDTTLAALSEQHRPHLIA
jgi:two-component system nitrate/nitrite response regulator NarL